MSLKWYIPVLGKHDTYNLKSVQIFLIIRIKNGTSRCLPKQCKANHRFSDVKLNLYDKDLFHGTL